MTAPAAASGWVRSAVAVDGGGDVDMGMAGAQGGRRGQGHRIRSGRGGAKARRRRSKAAAGDRPVPFPVAPLFEDPGHRRPVVGAADEGHPHRAGAPLVTYDQIDHASPRRPG